MSRKKTETTFGERLRNAREAKGLSRRALGEMINLSEDMIVRYERGSHEPKLGSLRRLAVAIGVPITDLIG